MVVKVPKPEWPEPLSKKDQNIMWLICFWPYGIYVTKKNNPHWLREPVYVFLLIVYAIITTLMLYILLKIIL